MVRVDARVGVSSGDSFSRLLFTTGRLDRLTNRREDAARDGPTEQHRARRPSSLGVGLRDLARGTRVQQYKARPADASTSHRIPRRPHQLPAGSGAYQLARAKLAFYQLLVAGAMLTTSASSLPPSVCSMAAQGGSQVRAN
jgi:hypothetical protein